MTENISRLAVEQAIRDLEAVQKKLIADESDWLQVNMALAYLSSIHQELEKDHGCQSKLMVDHYAKEAIESLRQAHFLFFDELDFDNAGAIKNILREVFSVNI